MVPTLLVALGGALGSVARYWVGIASASLWTVPFPLGTLIVNVVGSFVIGGFVTLSLPHGPYPVLVDFRVFVVVGLCGGFTTFSSFSLQTVELLRLGDYASAVANVVLSLVLCLLATAAGHLVAVRLGAPG